jgi:uncharacterized membrane-anchored protein YitT (DUF2179 family)
MKKARSAAAFAAKIIIGDILFALGFNLFLTPHGLNAGGLSGLAMVLVHFLGFGTVGIITAVVNLPLFIIGGKKLGKNFFFGSLLGMVFLSLAIDLLTWMPVPDVEPLIAALYGGVICGVGLGIVFSGGASTGGSDIVVRLLKLRYRHVPIGIINICFDLCVAVLTGLAFQDVNSALYSGVAIFVTGNVVDAVVYSFDYSKVALIISPRYEEIAKMITNQLERGATFLHGQGVYKGNDTKVVLTAVKKQQLPELKRLVSEIDPDAFVIVQEAHQVLGDGFSRYSKEEL